MTRTVLATVAALALVPSTALANVPSNSNSLSASNSSGGTTSTSGNSAAAPTPGSAAEAHPDPDQAVIVTGVRRSAGDVLGGVSVLDQESLTRNARPSIGETLAKQPGVTASSFGPTASRPILRGLSGERVRVLVDGIGSLDLSSSDPDHR